MVAALGRSRFGRDRLTLQSSQARAGVAFRRTPAFLLLGLLFSACAAAQPPDASNDSTEFSTSIGEAVQVPAGEHVEQDLLAMGSRLTIDGEAGGDAVAIRGDLIVNGHVAGDALALGGRVRIGPQGHVDGNAFSLFGGVDLAEGGVVDGRIRSLAPLAPGETAGYRVAAYSKPALIARFLALVFWILAALVAAVAAPTTVACAAAELNRHPLRLVGIGALLGLSFLLTLVLSVALIPVFVGIPLLVLLLLAALALVAAGLAAAFHGLGSRVAERVSSRAVSGYAELLAGALVLSLLHFVPVVGELLWFAAVLGGSGAVMATRLRRRPAGR